MANLAGQFPVRALIVGYPGSAKTGALAALADAGLKLRVIAFDKRGNMQPLYAYSKPENHHNIDVELFEDKIGITSPAGQPAGQIEPIGIPDAFPRAMKMLDHWKYKNEDGTEVDLGHSKDWGLDTVVVIDSLTSLGDSSKRRARKLLNARNPNDDRVYGVAMAEQEQFIERLMSSANKHHVIVLSHLRIIGPRDKRKGDSEIMEKIKEDTADLIRTRLFPSALGWQLPQQIGRHFPIILEARAETIGTQKKYYIRSVTDLELDVKVPANVPAKMEVKDALVKVFDAVSPGWRTAVEAGKGS